MEPLLFLILFALAIVESHAASPAEVYWHAVLPNTPMPSAIHDILAEAGTTAHIAEGGLNFNTSKGKTMNGRWHAEINVNSSKSKEDDYPCSCVPYIYSDEAPATEIQNPFASLFFLQKDLHPGANRTLHFIRTSSGTTLLPRPMADSIPFSSIKLPEILARFSIEPNSIKAESINNTLQECEESPVDGWTKYCATSLESMVDFSMSTLGTHDVRALSTTVDNHATPKQVYTMSKVRKLASSKFVSCHVMNYVYTVFYCHSGDTVAYTVSMVGNDGTKVEAVAACHIETTRFNPKNLAFQVLHVKPGTLPVCHFLRENDILWSPKK